jgi:hypothetical protein
MAVRSVYCTEYIDPTDAALWSMPSALYRYSILTALYFDPTTAALCYDSAAAAMHCDPALYCDPKAAALFYSYYRYLDSNAVAIVALILKQLSSTLILKHLLSLPEFCDSYDYIYFGCTAVEVHSNGEADCIVLACGT